jgi:hypothetical protein
MARRILILFPDEWDRAAARDPRYAGRYEFLFEGFDLFSFPDNVRLFTFDALAFVEKLVRRYRAARLDAVITSDEQFGPFIASLVAARLGLRHARLDAVLTIQHKYHAREAFERLVPQANARFALIRRGFERPDEVPLPYPFYVKPAKAAFSVLARRIDRFEDLHRHTRFGWLEGHIIDRLVRPFGAVARVHRPGMEDPFSMVCEEILRGPQVTANGFVRDGKVTMLGTVDSIMYPGTDHFMRFQYPSALDPAALARIDAVAVTLLEGLGLGHGMFNIEMRIDPATGTPRVIEINPRAAGQFFDLFERVDGYSLFQVLLDLECGEAPRVLHGKGRDSVAASFVLRDFEGRGLSRTPSRRDIAALEAAHPGTHLMVYPKRGAELAREMKWLGSYRYVVFNAGAATSEALHARFERLCRQIDFHPEGHPLAQRPVAGEAAGAE